MPTTNGAVFEQLKKTNAYANRRLVEPRNNTFLNIVLSEFERIHATTLQQEHRILAGAETGFSNTTLPASYQREVIRQAFADLNILELVRMAVDPTATDSTQIPYEERGDVSAILNGGIVFEGQGIPFVGMGLKRDTAYITPMKLALKVTNEVIHFSQANGINWDAWAESIASNARVIKELISRRITSEMQRAGDSYNAVTVVNEAFTTSDTGMIKTVHFPLVRPFQARTIQGETVGNPENPLVITINGEPVPFFTGGKNLPTGQYWAFSNINLGYIQLVDQQGSPTGDGLQGTISYSYSRNLMKFDLQAPSGVQYATHLNGLLAMVGDQKAMLSSHRFSRPDYLVMSYMLNNEVGKAEQMAFSMRREGTSANLKGDLDEVKGLPVFDTNAPGDFGDMRILLGQCGLTGYTIAKPYSMGTPFEAVDANGLPTGEKIAYGEEYSAIHTPKPVRNRYASILVFDSSKR